MDLDIFDFLPLIGLVFISVGLGLIYMPLFYISLGVWLVVFGMLIG